MISEKMYSLGASPSKIRDIFEYGKKKKAELGEENVYDFSIGNPSVSPPDQVMKEIEDLVKNSDTVELFGYTSGPGDMKVREAISDYINRTHGTHLDAGHIYMTCGAAASLTITIKALTPDSEEKNEFITFAPYFPEYKVFVENAGADFITARSDSETFQPDIDDLEKKLTPYTRGIIINSPNNPTGAVITKENIEKLSALLKKKEAEYGHEIYLISDEPYRELVYGDAEVVYPMNCYDDTIVCYSYSKSLSLPGERIGYIAVSNRIAKDNETYLSICGAGRSMGYVCAPSLIQKVIAKCQGLTSDISVYKKNRDILAGALREYGYYVVQPDGAFYLFVRSLEPDANAFAEKAKGYNILFVPSDSFGVTGYVRISYCVSQEMIERSLPAFKELAKSYGIG